jgi:ribosomal-protein-alanine N-acetyltransferase
LGRGFEPHPPHVLPDGYDVRPLDPADAPALAAAYRRNRDHLMPTGPVREDWFFSDSGQTESVARTLESVADGTGAAWLVWAGDDVVGRVALSGVVRGFFLSANLGYWTDVAHTGRGLATAAVEVAVAHARAEGLHRLEAGTLVDNVASQRVLEKCGFVEIGLAPRYLMIAGRWQDHRLFQRLLE